MCDPVVRTRVRQQAMVRTAPALRVDGEHSTSVESESKASRGNCMPMVKCPVCEKEFQCDDWYDFRGGNEEVQCPNCEAILYCTYTESIMYANFQTTRNEW